MGKCMFLRKGSVHEAPVTYAANFADNTWEQIIEACQKNKVPKTWNVGDQKIMTIGGYDYNIDIIGKNHDVYSTGGTAPLTLQTHECYPTKYSMNSSNTSSGGWTSCRMRDSSLPSLLTKMPSAVQSAIKEVSKTTGAGNNSTNIVTTNDKLFLLSQIEIFGQNWDSASGEGTQYAYYAAGNSKIKRIVNNTTGVNEFWWTRSPTIGYTTSFNRVQKDGNSFFDGAYSSHGVSFAFCF